MCWRASQLNLAAVGSDGTDLAIINVRARIRQVAYLIME